MTAFHKDPARKTRLLDRDKDEGVHPMLSAAAKPADLIAWADEMGLSQPFVALTVHLARGDPGEAGRFVDAALAAIEPGTDLGPVPHEWVGWAWQGAPKPLRALMPDAPSLEAGQEAIGLHVRAANGGVVDRSTWRAIRSKLNRLAEAADDAAAAAVLAASCWDFGSVPGAASDTANAWEKMLYARIRREAGWDKTNDARVQQIITEQRAIAEETVGPAAEGVADDVHRKRVVETLLSLVNQLEEPLLQRNRVINETVQEAFRVHREHARGALLALLRAPATAET